MSRCTCNEPARDESWNLSGCEELREAKKRIAELERELAKKPVPAEVLDLLRFMCDSWAEIDEWAYKHVDGDALVMYPVIQGTRNQIDLKKIGEQEFEAANIRKAVNWMLSQQKEL